LVVFLELFLVVNLAAYGVHLSKTQEMTMLVFVPHKSESLCIAHIAMMQAANPQISYDYSFDDKHGWRTFWDDGQIKTKEQDDEY
jgi:hypothetical protein